MTDQVRINGTMYGWADVHFKVGSDRYYGIKSISYGDSRERGKAYGSGRHYAPRGRTAGKYATEPVAITVEKATADALRAALAAQSASGTSFGSVEFDVIVQYINSSNSPITDTISRCVFAKQASKAEESPDPLYEDLELDCMRVLWNGRALFDDSEGRP